MHLRDPSLALREEERRLEQSGEADPRSDLKREENPFRRKTAIEKLQAEVDKKHRMENFLARRLPDDLEFQVLSDPSQFVKDALQEVRFSAITGGILAVIILYLFLNRLGSTGIIAVSIPLSIIATFAPGDL